MVDAGERAALELLTKGWDGLLAGHGRGLLEAALPVWLGRQRWFGAKTRTVAKCWIVQWIEIPVVAEGILPTVSLPTASTLGDALMLVALDYTDGTSDRYQVPLAFATGAAVEALRAKTPGSIVLAVETPTGEAVFHDALVGEELRQALLGLIENAGSLPVEDAASASAHVAATLVAAHESRPAHEISSGETEVIAAEIEARHSIETAEVAPSFVGHMPGAAAEADDATGMVHPRTATELRGLRSHAFAEVRGEGPVPARISSAEQSNTNVIYGQRMILKVFRRLQPGLNPDVEIGRFLTEVARFDRIAPFLGELTVGEAGGAQTTLAMLQGLVANEGDGWQWTQDHLVAFYAAAQDSSGSDVSAEVSKRAGGYLEAATLLGRRTAEMHLALATPTDDAAFAAEPFTAEDLQRDTTRIEAQIVAALDALEAGLPRLAGDAAVQAEVLLVQRDDLLQRARVLANASPSGDRIRIHGDYHLGQILRAQDDFVLLDFEGEPARSLVERRRKQSPLKDVAGMLRSFSYAAYSGLDACAPGQRAALAPWARAWETAVCDAFLNAYRSTAGASASLLPDAAQGQSLLSAYLLEKALYELLYELNNRPAWVGIPLAGILALREG